MKCPRCASTHIRKNGKQRGKQNYICVNCKR
ncbi:MAG: IS1 family transposase, partial [Tolypothrix carrinoi HA7290-LM1]|nr:IS1 family transposase [Tolypothrix carrinoi HA7290-LM1]